MLIKKINYKYNKFKAGARLNFIANKYKSNNISAAIFLDKVNKEYYEQFSILYKSRETSNISNALDMIINKLKNYRFNNIFDIGAGEGFINNSLKNGTVEYEKFYNCDPYQKPLTADAKSDILRLILKNP